MRTDADSLSKSCGGKSIMMAELSTLTKAELLAETSSSRRAVRSRSLSTALPRTANRSSRRPTTQMEKPTALDLRNRSISPVKSTGVGLKSVSLVHNTNVLPEKGSALQVVRFPSTKYNTCYPLVLSAFWALQVNRIFFRADGLDNPELA